MNPLSIFLDVQLPTAATWFYFSGVLAAALFVKFSRLLSVRNWDVFTLFLFAPGFLLLLESPGRIPLGLRLAAGRFRLLPPALPRRPDAGPPAGPQPEPEPVRPGVPGRRPVRQPDLGGRAAAAHADAADSAPSPIDEVLVKTLPQTPGEVVGFTVPIGTARALALLCHLSVVVGLVLIGWKHFGDVASGMAMAAFYLLLPYTYMLTPNSTLGLGRWDHVWPMAWMVWSVFCYRRPTLAGAFLGVAAGGVLLPGADAAGLAEFLLEARGGAVPAVVRPVRRPDAGGWRPACCGRSAPGRRIGTRRRRWAAGSRGCRPTAGVWQGVYWVYRLPVFIVYAAFVITTLFWPIAEEPGSRSGPVGGGAARHPVLVRRQRRRVRACGTCRSCCCWCSGRTWTTAQPPPTREDWVRRLGRRCTRMFLRLFRRRKPARVA